MAPVCSKFNLVTEFTSKIDGHITFISTSGNFSIRGLPPFGTSSVNLPDLNDFFSHHRSSKIRVYLNGHSTTIYLKPRHLLKEYVRIIFEFENNDEGQRWLVVKGLVEQNDDFFARIRIMSWKRSKLYAKREATQGLVKVIGRAIVEQPNPEVEERQENPLDAVDVIDDSASRDDRTLTYYKPTVINGTNIGEISDEDVDKYQVQTCTGSLVCFIGHEITIEGIEEAWKDFQPFEIHKVADGFVAVRFNDEKIKFDVLERGQWFIKDKPLIVKIWSPDMVYDPRSFLVKLPLWIGFRGLNEACWTIRFLSNICSTIGVPLFVDECTRHKGRSGFARVCVEFDTREELKEIAHFKWKGNMTSVFVVYEWKPDICALCLLAASQQSNMINVPPPELVIQQHIDLMMPKLLGR